MRAGLILILLAGGVLCAQPAKKYPLVTLQIQGNKQIPAERIAAASGLKQGALVDKADFDAARERLLESGAFESVGYSFKPAATVTGYDTTFEVVDYDSMPKTRRNLQRGSGRLRRRNTRTTDRRQCRNENNCP